MITCSAPGKIYFSGEHAVVYGEKAIAAAINLRTRVTVQPSGDFIINSSLGSTGLDDKKHPYVTECIRKMKDFIPTGVKIDITSDLPVGSGLGSSAAVTIATLYALGICFNTNHTLSDIADLGYGIERTLQGAASPTDTFVSTMGGVITVPDRQTLTLPKCHIVIGNTGSFSSTRELVASVNSLKQAYPDVLIILTMYYPPDQNLAPNFVQSSSSLTYFIELSRFISALVIEVVSLLRIDSGTPI